MKFPAFLLAPLAVVATAGAETTLRQACEEDFTIGVALNSGQVSGSDEKAAELVGRQFNSLTAENDMKWQLIHPEPERYNFERADLYVDFAEKHDMEVIGHTFPAHSLTQLEIDLKR